MISDVEKYQGIVLRQLVIVAGRPIRIDLANSSGRLDAFSVEGGAIQIKYSSKRLSPWQFTYIHENLNELSILRQSYSPVWVMLVCGFDGVVGLTLDELFSIIPVGEGGGRGVRVSRSRNAMYRVTGSLGELERAKSRGVKAFVSQICGSATDGQQ